MKLSTAMRRRLLAIADYRATASFPHIGFWPKSRTDQALERLGLIESYLKTSNLGGAGAIGLMRATFPLARLTPDGVLTAEELRKAKSR
jgi:hypothetical protein